MDKIKLTCEDIKQMVIDCINETKKIQPWAGSPKQPDLDWCKIADDDDEFSKKNGLSKKDKIDSAEDYMEFRKREKATINNHQKQLTDKLQQRAKESGENPEDSVISQVKGEVPENIKKALKDLGLDFGVKGKVFSFGNSKLPPSTLIINITSSFACPIDFCPISKDCYAKKIGRAFTSVEKRDLRNMMSYKYMTTKDVLGLVEAYIENAPSKIHDIRLNESGDFQTQEQVDFIDKLAGHIKAKYGIKTTAYTRAKDLDFTHVENIIINASDPRVKGADRYFLVVGDEFFNQLPDTDKVTSITFKEYGKVPAFKCSCDCRRCRFCYNTRAENGETGDTLTRVFERLRKTGESSRKNKKGGSDE